MTQLKNLIDFGELQDLTAIEFSFDTLQSYPLITSLQQHFSNSSVCVFSL